MPDGNWAPFMKNRGHDDFGYEIFIIPLLLCSFYFFFLTQAEPKPAPFPMQAPVSASPAASSAFMYSQHYQSKCSDGPHLLRHLHVCGSQACRLNWQTFYNVCGTFSLF